MKKKPLVLTSLLLAACGGGATQNTETLPAAPHADATAGYEADATRFLEWYNAILIPLYARATEAQWAAATDVSDRNTGQRIGADSVFAAFSGSAFVIERSRELLAHRDELSPLTARQLEMMLLNAAEAPGTAPELAQRRVELEAQQSEILDGFQFCLERGTPTPAGPRARRGAAQTPTSPTSSDPTCRRPANANDIEEVLSESTDLAARLRAWEASKEVGVPLGEHILELRDVRNQVAREMGYDDFMSLQVADYGMTRQEMLELLDGILRETRPLFEQVHCYAKHELADRYGQPAPRLMPAHWLGNRWGQSWPGLVEAVDLDPLFENQQPQWITEQAERFYVSMGFPELPDSFWERSDLYPVAAGGERRKNSHASAWHMDLGHDVRSLMSVEPNAEWFGTAHHELGHIYYYLSYTTPEVPPLLREGANRAFHEAIGSLIGMAANMPSYLRQVELLPADRNIDSEQWLLADALTESIVFFPFAAGTMTHFENDLYAGNLTQDELNARWWQYVAQYQGIEPPNERPVGGCDACTKTHINDDPGQYYDYALATVILHQIHAHICSQIVHADPHDCNYYGNREVGAYLNQLLRVGATRDWRELLRETTGEDLSARALVEYYRPLTALLTRENEGRTCEM